MKLKLFLYLLGSQGREIYSTMAFEAPGYERNLKKAMDAFDKHCNPKKNETVERYKFFTCFQNPGESLEMFITYLKFLATTCNFGDLKDSLAQFARHGIPETCVSDNGSQFISDEFKEFSRHWSFAHVTSSPSE